MKTMRQIEKTFFDLAALDHKHHNRSVLIICDRGLLDPSACEAVMYSLFASTRVPC